MAPLALADNANNLVQLDLKRASNNSVDVTLFTTNNYEDNVMVRKKSDNKYVILIPKVQSSGFSASNLNGVKDLISNIDIKTVNDTSGGYTKVTLITTKPLEIKTSAKKSAPITSEQKEYQTLIAQANAIKNNIAKPDAPPKLREQKTEVTVNKASATKPIKKVEPKKQEIKKTEIKLEEIDPEKIQREARRQNLEAMKQEVLFEQNVPEKLPQLPETINEKQPIQDIQEISQNTPPLPKIKNKTKHIPKKLGFAIIALFGLSTLIKLIKNSAKPYIPQEIPVDDTFASNIKTDKINEIINNNELTWKERYQMYLDKSAVPVSRGENKGNYMFIKTPNIEQKREKLEKLEKLERLERLVTEPAFDEIEPEIIESEDEVISKAIKFKAFNKHPKSLKMTSRDKSRFKKYEVEIPLHEQKNIELGNSALHSNQRSFADANLKIADVDKKRVKYEPKEYIMSSMEEYFSILDKEQSKITATTVIASNPITKHRNENKSSYLKGLIVKSGYNIDDNKGFYLVNKDGQNALIGKVNEEVFVLKRFDKNVTSPMQVRHDKDNVYMVKAGDFKSLVEVNQDKMGVLIEL